MQGFRKKALPAAISLALGTGALLPGAAQAGWYVGVGAGQSSLDEEIATEGQLSSFVDELSPDTLSLSTDDSDTGWKVFGGYRFNDWFAAEGYYADLGTVSVTNASGTYDGGEGSFSGAGDVDVEGFGVNVVGIWPILDFMDVHARLGMVRWTEDESGALSTTEDGTISGSVSDEGIDVTYGAGVGFTFMEHLGFSVDWENFSIGSDDVDLVSGSVTWEF
jgi:OOP family OmpA-OmpF porin